MVDDSVNLKIKKKRTRVNIKISKTDCKRQKDGIICSFLNGQNVCVNVEDVNLCLDLKDGRKVYFYGEVFYCIEGGGSIQVLDNNSDAYLENIFSQNRLPDAISMLEGQYVGLIVDKRKKNVRIFSDRYARVDTFYTQQGASFILATDMDVIFEDIKPEYDQKMIAHMFMVFGWFAPKGMTIYKNVKQLKVGEILVLSESGINSEMITFKPLDIENYCENKLEEYYNLLRESIIARANHNDTNWVSSSSGWDSSVILAILVDEFGPEKVRMMTGSMKYSKGTDIINKFEIGKTKKIGEFYGIKPDVVDLDFQSSSAIDCWKKSLPYYKSKHNYTYVTHNFSTLSDSIAKSDDEGQVVFNGETSDSFHNFGFSQYATFFHTQKSFTEYADKMNCYLYGPSFFKKVLADTHGKDKVFQIFSRMLNVNLSADDNRTREGRIKNYLFPFFYGSPRIPFARTYENPVLTTRGKNTLHNFPFVEYMPEVISGLTEKNIYSWLIYLYHSQGSTASVHKHGMEWNDHGWRSPFNDYRIIDFLSKAPESWGRGLEMNNTKYPLKWVAHNKIKFPYELLDEGPHSYLYDVIEGFSLYAEMTYHSGVTKYFKEVMAQRKYKDLITDEYIDVTYLDNLVTDYLDGKEVKGADFNNLVTLITLCVTGWY